MASRLRTWTMALAILAIGTTACGDGGNTPSQPASRGGAGGALNMQVVVDIAVAWQPEGGLAAAAVTAQRLRIESAQDELVQALGAHGSLVRRLTGTAQVAMAVDEEGRALLASHRLAARVQEDRPDAPSGAAAGPGPTTVTSAATPAPTTAASPAPTTASGVPAATGTGPSTSSAPPPTQPAMTTTEPVQTRRSMIVTLAVAWRAESELGPAGVTEQRARIERAQDELVQALGDHGTLARRLTETAQLAVSADETGIALLSGHPLVKAVQTDSTSAPSSSN